MEELRCTFEGCGFITRRVLSLKRHIRDCHSGTRVKNVQCPMCSKSFFTIPAMRSHLQSHTNEKPWQCSLCNFEAQTKDAVCHHEERRHGKFRKSRKKNLQKCNLCDFTTTFRPALDRHLPLHSLDRQHVCTVPGCSFRAKRTDTLANHMTTHVSMQLPCSVAGCRYVANNAGVLRYHQFTKHNLPFPCVCPDCKARFSTQAALISHQRFHGPDRRHQCDSCLRRFSTTSQLNYHILHAHEKPQRFQCTICDYCTSNRSHRNIHMKNVHRLRDVLCNEPGCNFRSCSVEDLDHHGTTRHDKSRPFKCKYCPHRFDCSSGLNAHLKRKHGDEQHLSAGKGRPPGYCCEICGRMFESQVSLWKHSALHKVAIVMLSRTQVRFS